MQLRIGTRKSILALAQAEIVKQKLIGASPSLHCELVPMLTTGDRKTGLLADIGGKGLFTRELEEGLLQGHIDIAVHSLKDMETHLPSGLTIGTVLKREDPRDVFVAKSGFKLAELPAGSCIGTSSPRRTAQLAIARPDLKVVPFRGNVNTRIAKLEAGEVDATLLAFAGLRRLGLEDKATEILDVKCFTPAAGQGTIAVETRQSNTAVQEILKAIQDWPTHYATLAERSLLAAIGGSCRTPIGAYARLEEGRLKLDAMLAKPGGGEHAHVFRESSEQDAEAMGKDAGKELLSRAGKNWFL